MAAIKSVNYLDIFERKKKIILLTSLANLNLKTKMSWGDALN